MMDGGLLFKTKYIKYTPFDEKTIHSSLTKASLNRKILGLWKLPELGEDMGVEYGTFNELRWTVYCISI